jgi:hypothetical protein
MTPLVRGVQHMQKKATEDKMNEISNWTNRHYDEGKKVQ